MTGTKRSSLPSHQDEGETSCEPRSKRRRFAEPKRKRVARACLSCRRLKEKCDGNSPCSRCIRYRRSCEAGSPATTTSISSTTSPKEASIERSAHLETIARHFLGEVPLDAENLKQVVENLRSQSPDGAGQSISESDARSRCTPTASLGVRRSSQYILSDVVFTHRLHDEVQIRLKQAGLQSESESSIEQPCSALVRLTSTFRKENLPPKDVAVFLVSVYFDFAQTTTHLVEQQWMDDKIERLYSWTEALDPQDHPWLCSVLAVLAIGVQYAHLAEAYSRKNTDSSETYVDMGFDRDASIRFYHLAVELVPDALLLPCSDSIQAFILLAHLTLTWNETGQAYGYLGAAIRIAAQMDAANNGHPQPLTPKVRQTHDRLSQVAYAWDRRISIFHGIPSTNGSGLIDPEELQLRSADAEQQQISLEASTTLFIQLTSWLGSIADSISSLHGHGQNLQSHSFERLMGVRNSYKRWWSGLDISRIPILQLNKRTAPLHLCHHLNLVFMGRSFALKPVENPVHSEPSTETYNATAELVDEAEYSAYEIIDICTMLEKSTGLSGVSYIESNACRAAVCVMLAQSLIGRCHLFRGKLQEGINLVRKMAQIAAAYTAGSSKIDFISNDVEKLAPHRKHQKYKSKLSFPFDADAAYRNFQNWARAGSKRPNADLTDVDVLIRRDGDDRRELQGIFDCDLMDSSLFAFDSIGSNGWEQDLNL